MESLAETLSEALLALGPIGAALGLFVVGFFDSSLISLPEVNDLLVVFFCTHFKERAFYFALAATFGSAAGCSLLYVVARWKGFSFISSRYSGRRFQNTLKWIRRFGRFALVIPAVMPPPFPFKVFVLTAGVTGLSFRHFITAILIGRGIRYGLEAYFSVLYGEHALRFLEANYGYVLGIVLVVVALAGVTSLLRRGGPSLRRAGS